ncbi:hypothetical protein HELRODRAFT_83187 [Helobdella robusta]|uniref:D-aminoacyl-tRNA deacylase n=1 Tax=Helobdella robusta TaxID=6412 RepID=T1G515_HELRO|nr:hypothetical protein HELRODRAFT_83187 [Helobdella robusta]ESO00425.1 hypothetical protein HELRODRAFT_83187 [Helobdella robusta]
MRAIIQRVTNASVTVDNVLVSTIGQGLCVLIGISREDTPKDIEYIVRKILNVRVFENNEKRWSLSVVDRNLEILCVSQFTLYTVLKGNKLDFHQSMNAEQSESFYNQFINELKLKYKPNLVKDGKFGALMSVNIQNDGPVTITLDSKAKVKFL